MTTSTTQDPARPDVPVEGAPGLGTRLWWALPALASSLLAALVTCAVTAIRRTEPFGPRPRGINDLSNQFVPFHAHLWDLLHGRADLAISWKVGLGVPFLPDYVAYLGSPFAPLVALFPRSQIGTAVFTITVLKIAVAAAVMTVYLLTLRRSGSRSVALLLGAAYATCGWALDDATYVTMWLDSLIALPAIALAMEHLRTRGRFFLPVLVVALFWWANAYSAVMATAGAGTLVLARVVSESPSVRRGILDLLRSLAAVLLGVALTSVVLLPFLTAAGEAQDSPERPFVTHPWQTVLARALPLTGGVGRTPGLYVGTVVLVLALSLPFIAGPLRRRLTYAAGAVLVLLSMQWPPTMFAWHAFEMPNGSQFRAAFAMCAWLVVCSWLAAAGLRRRPLALLGGASGVALLAVWAGAAEGTSAHTRAVALGACFLFVLLALVAAVTRQGGSGPRVVGLSLVVLLGAGVVVEGTWTGVVSDAARAQRFMFNDDAGPIMAEVERSLERRPGLPNARVAGPQRYGRNEAFLLGIPGGDYYSSMISARHSTGLRELGVTWTSNGLSLRIGEDSAIRALLGIRTALADDGTIAWTSEAAPIARRILLPGEQAAVASVFDARNRLAGKALYAVPRVQATTRDGRVLELPVRLEPGDEMVIEAGCEPGTVVTFDAPFLVGTVDTTGTSSTPEGHGSGRQVYVQDVDRDAPRELGVVVDGAGGEAAAGDDGPVGPVRIQVVAEAASQLPQHPVGCLDLAVLEEIMTEPAPPVTRLSGSTIEVQWAEPSDGLAVVSVPAYKGWRCETDSGTTRITPLHGLIAAPLDGSATLRCSFRQPGLLRGAALSLLTVGVLGAALVGRRLRQPTEQTEAMSSVRALMSSLGRARGS